MYAKAEFLIFASFILASVYGKIVADPGNGTLFKESNVTAAEQLEKMEKIAKKMQRSIGGDLSNTDGLLKIGKYKYWVSETYMDWWDAYYICAMRNARLAAKGIRDDDVLHTIKEYIVDLDKDSAPGIWIGLHDLITEGNWMWIDGVMSVSSNTPWHPGEPNNQNGIEDCAEIDQYYTYINDAPCNIVRRALCEYDA